MQVEQQKKTLFDILEQVEQDASLLEQGEESGAQGVVEAQGMGGDVLGGLLSSPELLSKLPVLFKIVQTLKDDSLPGEVSRPETPEQLLCALRPYLSEGRRQALDTMIRVSRVSASLKSLK